MGLCVVAYLLLLLLLMLRYWDEGKLSWKLAVLWLRLIWTYSANNSMLSSPTETKLSSGTETKLNESMLCWAIAQLRKLSLIWADTKLSRGGSASTETKLKSVPRQIWRLQFIFWRGRDSSWLKYQALTSWLRSRLDSFKKVISKFMNHNILCIILPLDFLA